MLFTEYYGCFTIEMSPLLANFANERLAEKGKRKWGK